MILLLTGLIISIILHEFAHFIVARKVGCPVEMVSLGFGKTLYQRVYKNIIYRINLWFIFGGDCQLKGERVYITDANAYCNLAYHKKVYIGLAGCAANLIIGVVCLGIEQYFHNTVIGLLGLLNIGLGIVNLLPIPCLDGSTLVFIWVSKFMGKEKGYNLFIKINRIALKIWIILNIISIPWFVVLVREFSL